MKWEVSIIKSYLNIIKNVKVTAVIILLSGSALMAQPNGSIAGTVTDKTSNEPLIGANVLLTSTTIGASTDIDGIFSIVNLRPGKYNLRVSYISYRTLNIADVEVKEGEETNLNISLEPASAELDEVLVTAEALQNSESGILKLQKNSFNIVDAVSAELISRNNSSDGTDILKRMPGITISDDKYAVVRGVGDRYNNTLLNGAAVPGTDPEKKSFSYDLIPAALVENIVTSKTFTPDKPADFTGGLVEIKTIEFPTGFFLNLGGTSGFDNETSFKEFVGYKGGSKDFLGFDDGTRSMPSSINGNKITRGNYSTEQLQEIGLSFKNNWTTQSSKAPLNGSLKINMGDRFEFDESLIGLIASLAYSNSVDVKQIENNNYTFDGPRYEYTGAAYSSSVNWGGLLNLSYKFGKGKNKVSFKNMYNRISDDQVTIYEGSYYYNPDYRKTTAIRYTSKSLLSSQLIGEHQINVLHGVIAEWRTNFAISTMDEPDARRYVYTRDYDNPDSPLKLQLDQSLFTRFFGSLDDQTTGGGADFRINIFENPELPKLKTGFNFDAKKRSFEARTFGFRNIPGGNFRSEDSILFRPVDEIFKAENINPTFIEIQEITKPSDSYSSSQAVASVYMMMDFSLFNDLKIITGLRYEGSTQKLTSKSQTGEPVEVNSDYNDVLPALTLSYLLNDQINLRFAFSRTLARPEFRELAPFSYFDFLSNEIVEGNPFLKRVLIDNYDLRFEMFPAPRELAAVSLFFKRFKDPIEQVLIASSSFQPIRSFQNAEKAINYGVELELRKGLDFLTPLLNNFYFTGNLSLIKSRIDVESNGFQESSRPLQGQADYIINLGVYYDNYQNGLSASVIYNKVGERIAKAGFANLGNVVEMPRNQVDLMISKNIFSNLNLKLSVKDLLAEDHLLIQRISTGDKTAERFKSGRNISVGISYNM